MTEEERNLIEQTSTRSLSYDLQEWLSNYYEADLTESISDELYEMFGDMADNFIDQVFEAYRRNI